MATPVKIGKWTRCGACGKPLAHELGPGSVIDCRACGATNRV